MTITDPMRHLQELAGGTAALLDAVHDVMSSPLVHLADRLHAALRRYVGHRALVIFTEDCTGRPQKKAGDEAIISRVTIGELDNLRAILTPPNPWNPWLGVASIAGEDRSVLAITASSAALLVLVGPELSPDPEVSEAALVLVALLWQLAAARIQEKISEAPPAYLVESRAASAERARITAEMTDHHATALETILAALRSDSLDDRSGRRAATELASAALVRLRTSSDRTISMIDEPVATAFARLRDDLRPLVRFNGFDIQFVEPPADGRALPGEIAHAARAVVRGLVLAMGEQPEVKRLRIQWDCDGENLLIEVRDDGPGRLSADSSNIAGMTQRVSALNGRMSVSAMPGWGSEVSVAMPLDPPALNRTDTSQWTLAPREIEVLDLLCAGKPNRAISRELNISENTVKFHVRNIFRKLGVSSRSEAAALAREGRV
ncbi:helix-turn-helix transcriptional regulator [Pseudarthrobacter sp. S9]|uniref:helix-turn-helix transcriptional regulator n=1 Tax=Pseudarthrobacter sp. S9 TaxID=3418421 RepID=UPI003CFC6774